MSFLIAGFIIGGDISATIGGVSKAVQGKGRREIVGAVVKGSVEKAVGQAGKMGFKTVVSGVASGAMNYLKSNAGWMIGRAIYKSLFVQPWGLIRWAL